MDQEMDQKNKQISELESKIQLLRQIRDLDSSPIITRSNEYRKDYQILSDKFDKTCEELRQSRESVQTITKRQSSETQENELLYNRIDSKDKDIDRLKYELKQFIAKFKEQNKALFEMNSLTERLNNLQKELDKEKDENLKLNEFVNQFREEHLRHEESNISVEDLNQSISNFLYSYNSPPVGESLDCVLEIKLSEVESALEEKRREYDTVLASNQDLKDIITENEKILAIKSHEMEVISRMNEELQNQTKALNEETYKKVTEWKTICTQLEINMEQLATDCYLITQQKAELDENLNREITALKESLEKVEKERDTALKQMDTENDLLTEEKAELDREITALKQSLENVERVKESALNENVSLEKGLIDEKNKVLTANKELQEIQTVVDKRFISFKDTISCMKQNLSEEQQKSVRLENELKSVNHIQSQQMANISKEYEKLISDLKTRLNTEELSFAFERKNKERYAKENEQYVRRIRCLEIEIKELKDLLNKPSPDCNGSAYYSMPTTININTNQPNFTNRSVSSIDISNPNCSNISFNISRKLPTGTGSRLIMADEEGEFMDPNHLNALKRGECSINDSLDDEQRMSILQRRNTMVLPHLRSSYGVELPFMKEDISPEEIKGFPTNDSIALKQIQNFSFQRNQVVGDRRTGSASCHNLSVNANKSQKRGEIENIRITSSKMSFKSITPTKMFKRVLKSNKSWTPHKK